MEGWKEFLRVQVPHSTVHFDNHNELLWTGLEFGYVNSFSPYYNYEFSLYPYTKFRSGYDSVLQIITTNHEIYSLSNNNINISSKRGLSVNNVNLKVDKYYDRFQCIALDDINNNIIVSKERGLFKVDAKVPESFTELSYNENVSFMHHQAKFLTLGCANGNVDIFDHNANQLIKSISGLNAGLNDMDVQGNYVVTCGYSVKHNNYFVDPLINLYDLRMMKLLAPISFAFGPSFVKFHPKLPNIVLIGSKAGTLQFLDIFDQATFQLYQVDLIDNVNSLRECKFSSNGDFISMSDDYNHVILWNFNDATKFNNFSRDLEHVPSVTEPETSMGVDDDAVPLNTVGMPYYKDLLLSNYAPNLVFTKESAKLPMKYDDSVPLMQFCDNTYDNNFNKYYCLKKTEKLIPFISDNSSTFDQSVFEIPNCYSKLGIKYSKFGVEDFNFSLFNATQFSGLENNLDNSYINSLIQLYKYTHKFEHVILKNLQHEWLPNDHVTINVDKNYKGSSVLNELGYLFDMMNKAQGKNCRIFNFAEFLNTTCPQELLNFDDLKTVNSQSLKQKTWGFNQWMLARIRSDFINQTNVDPNNTFLIKEIDNKYHVTLGVWPGGAMQTLADCLACHDGIVELPSVLSINVYFTNREFKALTENWLSRELHTNKSDIATFCSQKGNYKNYKCVGYVAEINNGPETSPGNHNLVTFVDIKDEWYLFNDFLVQPVPEDEVFDFQRHAKKPLVVVYQEILPESSVLPTPNTEILYRDHFAATIRQDYVKQYELLSASAPPEPGSLVAIDAEFVLVQKEVFEIDSSGVKTLIKPKKASLARVSVVDMHERCFVDDYIIHTQYIDDYVTTFSGIEPGDLDPARTTKNLVTFQTSYRRLWLLLNMGCVFVGHGLDNDFRTMNLHVPRPQIRDTLRLYFLPEKKRTLSLKFLSYVVLHAAVQVGNHDSIEDAKYALKLYKAYKEWDAVGEVVLMLDYVYREGKKYKFKVPDT